MDLRITSAVLLWLAAMILSSNAFSQDMEQELDRVSQDVSTYPYHRDFKTCPISIDIAYLIDGSSSVTLDEYKLEKTVVKVMAYFFGVMKLGTHNGVVNYGETAVTAIKFLDHVKFSTFRDAVKNLKKIGGNTRIDRALESAHDYLFMGGGGARASPKIPKIAIVFTDGVSGGQSLDKAVKPLVNKGVIVFAIGIGSKVNVQSLKLLTPRDDLLYLAKDFLDLYVKAGFIARQICQHAQNRGDFGPKGVQGPDGPAGPKGEPGPRGMEGERGNRGSQGAKGSKGEKGSKGSKGASGIDGAKGNVGSPGHKGPKGQKGVLGDTGIRGQSGDPGHDGDAGVRGPKGKPGPQGAKGNTGEGGENGSPGKQGTPGAKGVRGDKGDAGHPGAPGADGQNGSPGPKGQPGKPGSQGGRGKNGKPGPKGDQGPRGDKGLQGYPGARGPPGKDGNPGSNGGPGYDGSQGPRGEPGPRGPKGEKGQPGADGTPGYAGSRGSRGTKGAKGADANQTIVCKYLQSTKGQLSVSCNDLSYTATDCGCSRGCGEWKVSADGQKCSCKCNTYVPTSFASVGVNCCRLQ